MKEQLVGFKVFRKSKSIKKEQLQSVLNYVSDKRHAKTSYLALFCADVDCVCSYALQKTSKRQYIARISNRYFITIRKFKFERHTKQD
jgi:hypothetical protein